jgi:hypothetical protein
MVFINVVVVHLFNRQSVVNSNSNSSSSRSSSSSSSSSNSSTLSSNDSCIFDQQQSIKSSSQ